MFVTLMYHLIDDHLRDPMVVSSAAFEDQLRVLHDLEVAFLEPAHIDQLLDDDSPPSRDHVLISFDDGYTNTVEVAMPVLDAYGAPAIMSVCSSYLRPETRPATTPHISEDFADVATVRRWLAGGHAVGGHTRTHPKLTRIDDAALEHEVLADHADLTATFGRPPDAFFYPYGSSDARVERVVGRCYRNAFRTDGGSWPRRAGRLAMRRLQVRPEWDAAAFRRAVEQALRACRDQPTA